MLTSILYIIVSFCATVIGAITGIGGGIILKSVVPLFSHDSIIVVSFYTTILVFTMCLVSIYKQWRTGFQFNFRVLLSISIGSILGGYLGDWILQGVTKFYPATQVQLIQSCILFATLLFLILYTLLGPKKTEVPTPPVSITFLLGLFLGGISIFLGIGGGPLNISLLIIFFGYSMKKAAVYSIATVFFSQIAKLISVVSIGDYSQFNLTLVPCFIITALLGGYLGTLLHHRLTSQMIEKLYMILMAALLLIVLSNIVGYWI